jgi:D-arabinose 5-phosphate isomerase GutQ
VRSFPGIQSVFLHPLEALHGDLGVICPCNPTKPCDALLLISHSGATAELMRLLPIVRTRVRTLVAVTRDPDSILARSCTKWLDAGTGVDMGREMRQGEEKPASDEADCALPAPTSSVVAALAVGDALALCLSRMRIGWDASGSTRRRDFLRCHPGGQLGIEVSTRLMSVKVGMELTTPLSARTRRPWSHLSRVRFQLEVVQHISQRPPSYHSPATSSSIIHVQTQITPPRLPRASADTPRPPHSHAPSPRRPPRRRRSTRGAKKEDSLPFQPHIEPEIPVPFHPSLRLP